MVDKYKFYEDDIDKIIYVIEHYPTSMQHISTAVIEAEPLFENLGPDGLAIAVHNEIIRRGLNDR